MSQRITALEQQLIAAQVSTEQKIEDRLRQADDAFSARVNFWRGAKLLYNICINTRIRPSADAAACANPSVFILILRLVMGVLFYVVACMLSNERRISSRPPSRVALLLCILTLVIIKKNIHNENVYGAPVTKRTQASAYSNIYFIRHRAG